MCGSESKDNQYRPKVYLAGFDVFRPDAIEHGNYLKTLCSSVGMEGVYPLDNAVPEGLSGPEAARWICMQNMQMLSSADAVLANLGAFRGVEPDSGTVFEMGAAVAMGIPVWAYFPEMLPMRQQIITDHNGLCRRGFLVEDFGLPKNLMLACQWSGDSRSVESAVCDLAAHLDFKRRLFSPLTGILRQPASESGSCFVLK